MVRITSSTQGQTTTIRVEGRLEAVDVPDLHAECRPAGRQLRLDLSGLQSADPAGLDAIRSLGAEGAEMYGASPYVRQLLSEDAP